MNQATSVAISDDSLRLLVSPRLGGSILEFSFCRSGEWLSIMRQAAADVSSSSDTSSFLMAPYPNRIRNGRFTFAGTEYQLRSPEKHSIHGDVRNRQWNVTERRTNSVTLEFKSRWYPDINFPFAFSMQQSFSVSDSTLTICCRLRNEDSKAFPAGFGFHPYYNRALAGNDEEVTLSFSAQGAYPFSGDLPLPDGMALPLTEQLNFLVPREIPEKLDHCFAGFGGTAKLRWPTSKVTLQLEASAAFSHFVVYSPPGKPFVALEPQTQMNDGFNYLARGETSTGVVVLEPTQELAASVSLAVRAD